MQMIRNNFLLFPILLLAYVMIDYTGSLINSLGLGSHADAQGILLH